jgi:hypothetical protein
MTAFRTTTFFKTCAVLLSLLCAGPSLAQTPSKPPSQASAYRNLSWEEMVPKDWNPLQQFKGLNLEHLQDNDPKAGELLKKMRTVWDSAPSNPALAGAKVKIPGFIVPLEETSAGMKELLLVPYFGACIHTPPPPANQIIHVQLPQPAQGLKAMDTVWISGTLKLVRTNNEMGVSGYQMDAAKVEPYLEKPPR